MKVFKKQLIQIKKVDSDDLIYRFRGNTADENFDKFDNAFIIIIKVKNAEISLEDVKYFTKQETRLLIILMIILQQSLKQRLKQLKEQDLKQ